MRKSAKVYRNILSWLLAFEVFLFVTSVATLCYYILVLVTCMNPQMALKFEGVGASVGTVGALVWPFTCQHQITEISNRSSIPI